jgi:hypothetical protein
MKLLDGSVVRSLMSNSFNNSTCLYVVSLGLAGIASETPSLFRENKIKGSTLGLLMREDLLRMGITKLNEQLMLLQAIDQLLTLV